LATDWIVAQRSFFAQIPQFALDAHLLDI